MGTVRLGIIGCGHWGRHYVRIFHELPGAAVAHVADTDRAKVDSVRARHPLVRVSTRHEDLLEDGKVEAVVISTPAATHHAIARDALRSGKHVLLEKPLALRREDCAELAALAESAGRILLVGHTFLYNNVVRRMKEFFDSPEFGTPYYLHARRNHLGLIREDVDAVWDLAPHDVAIFNYLLGRMPETASAVGGKFLSGHRNDAAFVTLSYPGNVIGNIQVSWVDSNKIREVVAIGSRRRIVFNDLDALEPLRIFEKGVTVDRDVENFGEFRYLLRDGDILSPRVEVVEPLKAQCEHFLRCVEGKEKPFTGATNGGEVVRVLLAIQESLARGGAPVEVT
jgi:predicted dehydrogenase